MNAILERIITKFGVRNIEIIGIIALISIAFFLRYWGLQGREFWYDEAYTGILAKMSFSELFSLLKYDSHPPVYIVLIHGWISIFGLTDLSLRLLSVILGVLVIPITYIFLNQIELLKNNRLAKWLALIIVTFNPFLIGYSQEARSYSLVVNVFLLLSLSFYKAAYDSRYKFSLKWMIFALLCSVAFLTHYALVFGMAGLVMWDFLFNKKGEVEWRVHLVKKTLIYILVGVIFIVGIFPFLTLFFGQLENAPVLWWIPIASFEDISRTLYIFYFGADTNNLGVPPAFKFTEKLSVEGIGFILYSILLSASAYLFAKVSNRYKRFLGFLIFGSLVPIMLNIFSQYLGKRLYLERYLIAYLPLLIILSSIVLSKATKIITVSIMVIYVSVSIYLIANRSEFPSGYKELSETLRNQNITGATIVFEDPIQFTTAKYYLADSGNEIKIYNKSIDLSDWELTNETEILNSYDELAGKQRIFVSNIPDRKDIWYRDSLILGNLYIYSSIPFITDVAAN